MYKILIVDDNQAVDTVSRQCRIFKNSRHIRYQDSIHEQLCYKGCVGGVSEMDATNLSIYHTGYTEKLCEEKARRNIRILLREIKRKPDDSNVMGYLGDAYLKVDDEKAKAEQWYRKALPDIFQRRQGSERDIYTIVAMMLILYERGAEAEQELVDLYRKASIFTGFYDAEYIIGWFYAKKRDFQNGEYHLERAVTMLEQYGTKTFNPIMTRDLPFI